MNNYIQTIYNEDIRPITSYPGQLVSYLMGRYDIKPGEKLLDNGCGRGDFLHAFRELGIDAYGTDLEAGSMADDMKKIYRGGVNLERDLLPFEDNYFDVVFSKSVIEHIHNPSVFLAEMNRVLKPEGRIIIMVPDWHSQMYIYYDDCTHVQPYTLNGLRDALKMSGFQEVTSEKFYQLPSVWKHKSLVVLCKLCQAMGPVKKIHKSKFFRFSRELMILGSGIKPI